MFTHGCSPLPFTQPFPSPFPPLPHPAAGGVKGKRVLDLACGDGLYSRLLLQLGAADVVGVDLSEGMVKLARSHCKGAGGKAGGPQQPSSAASSPSPCPCSFHVGDVATDLPGLQLGRFELIVGMYLFNYCKSERGLQQMVQAVQQSLQPGTGVFLGFNDNVRVLPGLQPPAWAASLGISRVQEQLPGLSVQGGEGSSAGVERSGAGAGPHSLALGTPILYTLTNADGSSCSFHNYFCPESTLEQAFAEEGLQMQLVQPIFDPALADKANGVPVPVSQVLGGDKPAAQQATGTGAGADAKGVGAAPVAEGDGQASIAGSSSSSVGSSSSAPEPLTMAAALALLQQHTEREKDFPTIGMVVSWKKRDGEALLQAEEGHTGSSSSSSCTGAAGDC